MMRRAGLGIVVTPRQAELSLCWHLHAMRPSGPPPGGLTAPCTHSRSNQIKPRNCACHSPISMVCLPPADSTLILSKREHPITLFHSQTALVLQPGFTGLSTPFPVAAPCPLLVSPSPARPSDNGAGIDGFLDSEVVQQVADLRHGQGQQIGGQIGQVLSPRWPPFARRSGRPGRASPR